MAIQAAPKAVLSRAQQRRRSARPTRRRSGWSWLLFVLPGLGVFLLFEVWPLIQAVVLSFFRWDGYSPRVFVGEDNYTKALSDPTFWASLRHASLYALGTVIGKLGFGLGLALLLHQRLRLRAFYRSVVFAPVLMSFVAVGLLWQLIYSPQQGLFNGLLSVLHLPSDVSWLGDPNLALLSLIIVDVWKWTGYHTILFVAGLTLVSRELTEAATIDGAGAVQRFRYVTVPAIRPIIVVNLIIAVAGALNTFDLVYVMTDGGPYGVTDLPITYMYRMGFGNSELGYASAIACLMFVLVTGLTLLILRLQRPEER